MRSSIQIFAAVCIGMRAMDLPHRELNSIHVDDPTLYLSETVPARLPVQNHHVSSPCRSNITLPPLPTECLLICTPLGLLQDNCGDAVICMCGRAPEIMSCFSCVAESTEVAVQWNATDSERKAHDYEELCSVLKPPSLG
ncbi:hypothetical protein B0H10DRAFT_2034271 [Mycena sp. CBHHK59/15]|nr:hypothetical protein B0H10DRAFT_2034271 [Mycena sp. CBHHK59/15]